MAGYQEAVSSPPMVLALRSIILTVAAIERDDGK